MVAGVSRAYFVYVLASKRNGTLYVGMTGDLERRIREHKDGLFDGFTKRYNVHQLVHYEQYESPLEAIQREKNIEKWNRKWKLWLIEQNNPGWKDLSDGW